MKKIQQFLVAILMISLLTEHAYSALAGEQVATTAGCDPSCLTCARPNAVNQCVSCSQGYYLYKQDSNNQFCYNCPSTCYNCQSTTDYKSYACISQVPNSILESNSSSSIIYTCSTNYLGCSQCYNSQFCKVCLNGYFLQYLDSAQTYGLCINCKTGCTSCTAYDQCTSCSTGFALSVEGKCYYGSTANNQLTSSCSTGCSTCTTQNSCTTCNNGYYFSINSKLCYPCDDSCTECTATSKSCPKCKSGLQIVSNLEGCASGSTSKSSSGLTPGELATAIVVPIVVVLIILFGIFILLYLRAQKKNQIADKEDQSKESELLNQETTKKQNGVLQEVVTEQDQDDKENNSKKTSSHQKDQK